jgi:hypothetical protein
MVNVIRFVIWSHRSAESIFGPSSSPVNRNGAILSFENEDRAREECARLNARLGSSTVRYTVESENDANSVARQSIIDCPQDLDGPELA